MGKSKGQNYTISVENQKERVELMKENARCKLGAKGEEIATDFLKQNGYKILARNYKSNRGEIDIIAEDKNTITF